MATRKPGCAGLGVPCGHGAFQGPWGLPLEPCSVGPGSPSRPCLARHVEGSGVVRVTPRRAPQACIDENLEVVRFLVEQGATVNQADNEGWTPLHVAASCGYLDIAR